MTGVRIRAATPADAAVLAEMANALNRHVGIGTDPFTPAIVRRDGFGDDAVFRALLAEIDGAVAGYAIFIRNYNTDVAARTILLCDLFVRETARRRGAGRALMAAVAAETVARGARLLEWGVHDANEGAREFYRRLGARQHAVRIMELGGEALATLARTYPEGHT